MKCPTTDLKFCFLHNVTKKSGCASPCPKGLAHACEFCGDTRHTTVGCRSKPKDFQHPFKPSGKGKNGKGKGGGKGKKAGKKNADGSWVR